MKDAWPSYLIVKRMGLKKVARAPTMSLARTDNSARKLLGIAETGKMTKERIGNILHSIVYKSKVLGKQG